MMDPADIDPSFDQSFEPQFRERSNTWPLRPNRELLEAQGGSPASEESNGADNGVKKEGDPLGLTAKKSGSRRNAWGNLSYADLITKAIQSSPEKRLTLSQIYDWMVQNVPYFKDKGDSTSSAGWKNSIRHNLSLHSRFMRIQNEGTGKSSWWVINPDAKPGKAPRRRAGSMETKSYDKKRGRIKKKVQELRLAMENGQSPLNDDFFDSLNGLGDFRQRTSSNASSCGRLSPIHAGVEPDLHDSQVPPMSPIAWESDDNGLYGQSGDNYASDLVGSLVGGMTLSQQDNGLDGLVNGLGSDSFGLSNGVGSDYSPSRPGSYMSSISENVNENQFTHLPAPPPYPDRSPNGQSSPLPGGSYTNLQRLGPELYGDPIMEHLNSPGQLTINSVARLNSPDGSQQNSPNPQAFASRLSPHLSPQPARASPALSQLSPQQTRALLAQRASPNLTSSQQQQVIMQQVNAQSILREALTRGGSLGNFTAHQPTTTVNNAPFTLTTTPSNTLNNMLNLRLSPHHQLQQQQLQQQQQGPPQLRIISTTTSQPFFETTSGLTGCGMTANTATTLASVVGQTNGNNNNVPLDIDMDTLITVPTDYDMDSIIKQEMMLEGNLDFNFDGPTSSTANSQNIVH